jgi:competence protein ComEC
MPGASFRVPHYEGSLQILYVGYFFALVFIMILIEEWRPVENRTPAQRILETTMSGTNVATRKRRPGLQIRRATGLVLLLAAIVLVMRPFGNRSNGKLTLHFLDVGQGDSTLIVFPKGTTMLVDGGGEIDLSSLRRRGSPELSGDPENLMRPDRLDGPLESDPFAIGEIVVSRFLWSLGHNSLDYVVATHGHVDHIGGLSQVANNFRLGQAMIGRFPGANDRLSRLLAQFDRYGVPIGSISSGETYKLDDVMIEVLWPPLSPLPISENDDSVVLRLVYGSVSVLMAADIEEPAEQELLRRGIHLSATVLKVPHHGSKTSTSEAFLSAVNPRIGVISVGERSRFGHPGPEILERLHKRGVEVLKTGTEGTVTVETDGRLIETKCWRRGEGN